LIGTFNLSLKNITAVIDVMMHNVITGSPNNPTSKISLSPSFIPKNTIPNFKIVFKIKSKPCVKVSEILTRLLIVNPSRIDRMIGEKGLLENSSKFCPIKLDKCQPKKATIEQRRKPGKNFIITFFNLKTIILMV
tara:strand:+ start:533 stop:937 length:405 start_codon:yes stop_codon:yes gene_type:complete